MRTRILGFLVAVVLVTGVIGLQAAWATTSDIPITKADVNTSAITVSADDLSAVAEECPFALGDFARASVGSNREVNGAYHGYTYYIGSKPTDVIYIATKSTVVVYVNQGIASSAGFEFSSNEACANLQRLIVALDSANSKGNTVIPDDALWHFTSDTTVELDGLRFEFNKEIGSGDYYNCVIGVDGADITSSLDTKPLFCCFATMVASGEAVIVAQPTPLESFGALVARLDWSPLWVTLKTTLTAIVFIFILGLAAAYLCLHVSPRIRDIFDTIFTIPMVLPPTVCGFLLLLCLGSNTALGRWFIDIGFPLIFSWPATVIAAVVVAFPLMYRNARGAFENLDPNMLDAARTLGWSESRIFFKLMLPLSWSSIAAATVLAFARALGEFGATLFLAGNYLGITRTIPIASYFEWMNGNTDIALFWTAVILLFSFVVILFINLWSQHTTRYRKGVVEE